MLIYLWNSKYENAMIFSVSTNATSCIYPAFSNRADMFVCKVEIINTKSNQTSVVIFP